MNQKQRDFLVETITKKANEQITSLESKHRSLVIPRITSYLLAELSEGKAKLRSEDEIKSSTKLAAVTQSSFRHDAELENEKWLKVIYQEPPLFTEAFQKFKAQADSIGSEIESLKAKRDTLIMRVKLAPDKRLEVLISEIDDMGDISLMDSKLLLLGKEENQKLLG